MLRSTLGLGAGVLLCLALPARAEDPYARTGFYVGASVGLGVDDFEKKYEQAGVVRESGSAAPRRGYRVVSAPGRGLLRRSASGQDVVATVESDLKSFDVAERIGAHVRAGYRFHPRFSAELDFEILDSFDLEVTEVVGEFERTRDRALQTPRESITRESRSHSLRPMLLTANARAHLHTGRLQPYVLVGAGVVFARIRNHRERGYLDYNATYFDPGCPPSTTDFCFPPDPAVESPRRIPDPRTGNQQNFALRFGGGFEFYATEDVSINIGATYVVPTGDLRQLLDYWSIELFGMQYHF